MDVPGLYLVYSANSPTASEGDLLHFTVWIMNSTLEAFTEVNVGLRSLTNGELEKLQYTTQPSEAELRGGVLNPMWAINHTLTYEVSPMDALHGDLLISAIQVELHSPTLGNLLSECDVHVRIKAPCMEGNP